eukprot:2102594-Pyramimonas_sp.AAC.1
MQMMGDASEEVTPWAAARRVAWLHIRASIPDRSCTITAPAPLSHPTHVLPCAPMYYSPEP